MAPGRVVSVGERELRLFSSDAARSSSQVVHQYVLAKRHRGSEIGFALADLGHFLDEVDKVIVVSQHECVDQDPAAAAKRYLSELSAQYSWIELHWILVDLAVVQRHCRRFTVRYHDYLAHVLPLRHQYAPGEPQSLAGICVIRTNLD